MGTLILAAFIVIGYAEWKLSRLVLGGLGEHFSTRIYSAPLVLGDGARISPGHLLTRLRRLDYRTVVSSAAPGAGNAPGTAGAENGLPAAAGQYSWTPPEMKICLRGFRSPGYSQPEQSVILIWKSENAWTVETPGGLSQAALEPEVIAEISGPMNIRREPAAWDEIPENLKQAVVAAEDKRFFHHWGLDFRAMAGAAWHDLIKPDEIHGGSTITQQFAKNFFLSPQRTLQRKLAEAALAVYLELRYTKREILTLYLNEIYLGQDGSVSVAGVKAAAKFYFNKNLQELDLAQCALLAGIIRSPYRYNPLRNPEEAMIRRNFVLGRMRKEGFIRDEALASAQQERLGAASPPARKMDNNAYFTAEVIRQLVPRYGEDTLFRYGLNIYTTMDPLLQEYAQKVLREPTRQGALVALDPQDGKVLALAGGREYKETQFNRATQAHRQPGSAFKPFVYGAALERGWTAASILHDSSQTFQGASVDKEWHPKNYNEIYFGTATVRDALAHSLNAATLDLASQVGLDPIIDFARRMGIDSQLDHSLAMALGDSVVTLMELVTAYAPFANGGFRVPPHLIIGVMDAEGNVVEASFPQRTQVLEPAQAYLITSLLEGVVQNGTAKDLVKMGWSRPSAGKTGTTNGGRDAWFVGYTPQLLAGVWVGDDRNQRARLTGAKDAAPLWAAFMKQATADLPPDPFLQPQGLVKATIDPASGLLARSGCPVRRTEIFVAGTQPTAYCSLHTGGISGWFHRIFGKP